VIDNFDSFTWNLIDYIERSGEKTQVLRNNISLKNISLKNITGIVLSPGPGTPLSSGFLLDYIHVFKSQLPILGICLGHQAIGTYFGASLVKSPMPVHGKISRISCNVSHPLFKNFPPQFSAVRYHSLLIENLPLALEPIAKTEEGLIMAIAHKTLPIFGVQFHPEAFLTEKGENIIQNWVKLCQNLVVE